MELLDSPRAMRERAAALERAGRRVGLVPTMGFLHEGHLSLMRLLRPACDELWVSVFVNPAQFGPGEDLARYPRDLERDLALCRGEGVDGVLAPAVAAVYPPGFATWVEPGPVAVRYCGATRPGHFRGVLTIVLRLFMWTRCRAAAFGAKDAQQLWLIRRMARDLGLPVEIVEGATVREADPRAMSSRNAYLDAGRRQAALVLRRSLARGAELLAAGCAPEQALAAARAVLAEEAAVAPEYVHVADWAELDSLAGWPERPDWRAAGRGAEARPGEELVLLAAVRAGSTRLIDNLRVRAGSPPGTDRP